MKPHHMVATTLFILAAPLVTTLYASNCLAQPTNDLLPSRSTGAAIFQQRCMLCHGKQGLGEGILPLLIKEYPSTNLLTIKNLDKARIRSAVALGLTRGDLSHHSPPFGSELTWSELESVVNFVDHLRTDHIGAVNLLATYVETEKASVKSGKTIFRTQCQLCHGENGAGDGRLARVINSPPPANLTLSQLTDSELKDIIAKGGEATGRSAKMPPWGKQLSAVELESVILFVKSIRHPQ